MAALSLAVSACVGSASEEDIERFGDGTYCPEGFSIEALFAESCAGGACHGADGSPAGALDLVTPGFTERMIDAPSTICDWATLLVPGDPEASHLYVKLTSPPLVCGEPMPPVGYLSQNQLTCVRQWIRSLAPEGPEASGDGGLDDAEVP